MEKLFRIEKLFLNCIIFSGPIMKIPFSSDKFGVHKKIWAYVVYLQAVCFKGKSEIGNWKCLLRGSIVI